MENAKPSAPPEVEAKRSIEAEGVIRSPDDGECRHGSAARVHECRCAPTGVSGESYCAVENALPNDLELDAEDPADGAARRVKDVHTCTQRSLLEYRRWTLSVVPRWASAENEVLQYMMVVGNLVRQ